MREDIPLVDRCLAVEGFGVRCSEAPTNGQVLCLKHQQLRDAGINFAIAIVPLSEFELDELP